MPPFCKDRRRSGGSIDYRLLAYSGNACRQTALAADPTALVYTGLESPTRMTDRLSRITINIAQCGGRPCIRGMRIRVSDILDVLSAGATFDEVLEDYPYLEREDILAAIQYAARQTDHPVLLSA